MELQLYEKTSRGWWPALERGDVLDFLDAHVTFRFLFPYILLMVCLLMGGFAMRHMLVYIEKGLLVLQKLILFLVALFVVIVVIDVSFHALTGWGWTLGSHWEEEEPPPQENSTTTPEDNVLWQAAFWADSYTRRWFDGWI